jgi:GNAT superfamily N-acetyltransferase
MAGWDDLSILETAVRDDYVIAIEAEPKAGDMMSIITGLTEFNASKADGEAPNYLLATLRDKEAKIVGGLVGATYLGWLQVQALWVSDSARGGGYGKALLTMAENEAVRRDCPRVFLETLSFQALPFYEKCGYKVFSKLLDFPPGGARYALTKVLAAVPA